MIVEARATVKALARFARDIWPPQPDPDWFEPHVPAWWATVLGEVENFGKPR